MNIPVIQIVQVNTQQAALLAAISRQTFYDAFAEQNSEADMQAHLEAAYNVAKITSELSSPYSQFYFAMAGETVAGYIKVNFAPNQTELKDERALELERIYVLPSFQHQKIGLLLLQKAIALTQQHQLQYLWLGVWEHNKRAIAFYEKNGFVAFSTHQFVVGSDPQTDLLLKLDVRQPDVPVD